MARRTYNVLMVAPTPFFADYGCHVRIAEEVKFLTSLGNRVYIVTYHDGRDIPGFSIERVSWGDGVLVGSSASLKYKLISDFLLFFKSLRIAIRNRIDVIHAHLHEGALIGYVVGKILGAPVVFDFQGSLTDEMVNHHFLQPEGPFFGAMRALEWLIDHMPNAIIASSEHAAELLRKEFGCNPNKIHIVPDCVNPNSFAPGVLNEEERLSLKARLGIPLKSKLVVYLGLLAEYQGTSILLKAAEEIAKSRPDVHFLIMGYPGEEFYRGLATQLGIADRTTFTGRIPYEEAPRYLALGDVAVAPKLSATEGSGKILNYMAMSLPTVTFDTPVSYEYLGELGVYAESGNPKALADAISSLLDDEERAIELGMKLRKKAVEAYSWEGAVERIVRIYSEICG
jgi:glycosyltransferase involved in cell wall biosynthesis